LNMRCGLGRFATVIGLLTLAVRLSAQTAPLPILPPEPKPQPTPQPSPEPDAQGNPRTPGPEARPPQPTEASTQTRLRPWELGLAAGLGWNSNIDFNRPDGPSSVVFSPRGEIARNFQNARGQTRASATLGWSGYPQEQDLNRTYVGFGLGGEYRTSESTSWRIGSSYDIGYSDAVPILTQQGVSLELIKTRSLGGTVGLSQLVGQRTTLRLDGRIYRVDFVDSPDLANGQSLRGTVLLERKLSTRNAAAIVYSFERVLGVGSDTYGSHFGSLQWTRILSLRTAFLLEGGAGYTPDADLLGVSGQYSFFGGASFIRQIGKSSVTASFRREVAPAFGSGVSIMATRAGLRAAIPLGRDWHFGMIADYTRPDNNSNADQAFFAQYADASLTVGRGLGRHLDFSGYARYRRRGRVGTVLPEISSFEIEAVVSMTSQGRRAAGTDR
jgi:hypothetical protein